MFERRTEPIIPFPGFVRRLGYSVVLAASIISVALAIGVLGYHGIAGLSWVDALLNAAMILTGMGPVATMSTTASKLFATGYALFSGVVFLSSVALVISPIFHRFLHKFHLDDMDDDAGAKKPNKAPEPTPTSVMPRANERKTE